jgi:hypothetical protein
MLTVGHLARSYGQLPSHVLGNATTYDIMIDDVYESWLRYQTRDKDQPPEVAPEVLQEIINKSRKKL